jgi:hypothetical protein
MRFLIAFALFAFSTATQAGTEPDYAVLRKLGDVEVRFYASYTVAQVVVNGTAETAVDHGYPILDNYLCGGNKGRSANMPVSQVPVPTRLEKIVPVTQSVVRDGYAVQIVLPKRFNQEPAPQPTDARVRLTTVPQRRIAAIIFSGFWSEMNYAEHLHKLTAVLRDANLLWSGEPIYARYDPPGTPWFKRRNEIWLTLR